MPVIDGKVVRSRYSKLKLGELSSVDNPAQPGALATIMKRADPEPAKPQASFLAREIAKYVGREDGAHTFSEVLRENRFSEAIWPLTDAFSQSVRSIVGDTALGARERDTKITTTADEFLAAVRQLDPAEEATETPAGEVEKALLSIIKKGSTMKTVEQLQSEVEKLTGQLTSATALATTEKARADAAEAKVKAEEEEHGKTKKALAEATDEVTSVDGTEVRKSLVGEAQFSVVKALQRQAQSATLEKRAGESYSHLAGETAMKAKVLGAVDAIADEEVRKAATAILDSAEKMAAGGFGMIGSGEQPESVRKAQGDFNGKVAEIAKRDNIPQHEAMRKARTEFPAEFEAYQEAADAAANS